jgi:1,4-dihydroxy-2-naphthoate polyprenyltransferase
MARVSAYLGVARAPFLMLPFTLVAAGAAAAAYDGTWFWVPTLLALVGLVALHASVNALNEASDMRTGIDLHTQRTPFSGGSGTLPSGALGRGGALAVGYGGAAVGLLIGIWFVFRIGWPMLPLILAGGLMVLAYTDVLARAGIGEISAGLGLGALPVAGTALVQAGQIGPAAWAAAAPAFFMTFNLLFLNEFPDEAADRAGGRRNLVLLCGRRVAAWIYIAAVIGVPVAIAISVLIHALPLLALVAILPSAFAVQAVMWGMRAPDQPVPIPAMGGNVVWNLATNTVLAIALIVAAALGWH